MVVVVVCVHFLLETPETLAMFPFPMEATVSISVHARAYLLAFFFFFLCSLDETNPHA